MRHTATRSLRAEHLLPIEHDERRRMLEADYGNPMQGKWPVLPYVELFLNTPRGIVTAEDLKKIHEATKNLSDLVFQIVTRIRVQFPRVRILRTNYQVMARMESKYHAWKIGNLPPTVNH